MASAQSLSTMQPPYFPPAGAVAGVTVAPKMAMPLAGTVTLNALKDRLAFELWKVGANEIAPVDRALTDDRYQVTANRKFKPPL